MLGRGKLVYANGDVFEGEFEKDNKKQGKLTFKDGEIWECAFEDNFDNLPHGEGYRTVNGERKKARFESGEFVEYL